MSKQDFKDYTVTGGFTPMPMASGTHYIWLEYIPADIYVLGI
jgi:hypothetical protein